MFITVVVHIPVGAIGFMQRVKARDNVAVTVLVVSLVVASVVVRHLVLELVFRMSLEN